MYTQVGATCLHLYHTASCGNGSFPNNKRSNPRIVEVGIVPKMKWFDHFHITRAKGPTYSSIIIAKVDVHFISIQGVAILKCLTKSVSPSFPSICVVCKFCSTPTWARFRHHHNYTFSEACVTHVLFNSQMNILNVT